MTSQTLSLVLLLAPLVAFAIAFVGFRNRHGISASIVLSSGVLALICAVLLLSGGTGSTELHTAHWFTMAGTDLRFGILLDGPTLIMGIVVTLITLCVQVYSLSYMADDPGRGRFFAFLALFEWAMLSFVYAPNLLQTFIFWELVGLASFLLIGFWYQKPTAVAAAKKAFLMTRIGDVGLFVGLILLFQSTGSLDILDVQRPEVMAGLSGGRVELICGLIFMGIVGKSAQFPLHTWLPDAMEGPTPVSALLHSATMVAAGVFLFARFHDLFMQAPTVLTVVLIIATTTAILSSTTAMVAKDMKRVLAYSSISQLGFMLAGLAAGSLIAGMFHLITHAAFKALLFMCAGSFIHHYKTNDMIAIGRAGGRSMRITTLALLIGGGALAGIPPLAGFFSKELIIGQLDTAANMPFFAGMLLATFMTAYYTFRMIFLVIRPNAASAASVEEPAAHGDHDEHAGHTGSHEPMAVVAPLLLLSAAALGLGFAGDQIAKVLGIDALHHPSIAQMAPAVGVALFGVALAWLDFGRANAPQLGFIARLPALQRLFANGWYIDALYKKVFVGLAVGVARLMFNVENAAFDDGSDAVGLATYTAGEEAARSQSGKLQLYIGGAVLISGAIFLLWGLAK